MAIARIQDHRTNKLNDDPIESIRRASKNPAINSYIRAGERETKRRFWMRFR